MPGFRATIRWTTDRQRYHVEDIEAADLPAALERLRERIPSEVGAHADLIELRRQHEPDAREYAPE